MFRALAKGSLIEATAHNIVSLHRSLNSILEVGQLLHVEISQCCIRSNVQHLYFVCNFHNSSTKT